MNLWYQFTQQFKTLGFDSLTKAICQVVYEERQLQKYQGMFRNKW